MKNQGTRWGSGLYGRSQDARHELLLWPSGQGLLHLHPTPSCARNAFVLTRSSSGRTFVSSLILSFLPVLDCARAFWYPISGAARTLFQTVLELHRIQHDKVIKHRTCFAGCEMGFDIDAGVQCCCVSFMILLSVYANAPAKTDIPLAALAVNSVSSSASQVRSSHHQVAAARSMASKLPV